MGGWGFRAKKIARWGQGKLHGVNSPAMLTDESAGRRGKVKIDLIKTYPRKNNLLLVELRGGFTRGSKVFRTRRIVSS